jgi:L-iditol 2-dehydrogenase
MKALLLSEYKKLSVVDMPVPDVGDGDVLVRVRACGICGSDIHGYDGSTGRRIPPLVMGHEAAGVIERVGAGVRGLAAGDRVSFDSTVSCGACDFCRRGRINLCDNRTCSASRRRLSAARRLREYVAVPSRILYKLPDSLPFERAALLEAVSVAVHAVGRRVPAPDDTAVVVGSGMIGVLIVQVLRAKGVTKVIAVDVDRESSRSHGGWAPTQTVDAAQCDVPAAVRRAHRRTRRRRVVRGGREQRHAPERHPLPCGRAARRCWSAISRRASSCRCKKSSAAKSTCSGRARRAGRSPRASICSRAARSTSSRSSA